MNSIITLSGSHKQAAQGKVVGEVAPNKVLFASVQTPTAMEPEAIARLLADIRSGKRAPLTPAELKKVLGSKPEHVRAVKQAIKKAGLTPDTRSLADQAHGIVRFHGTYSRFQKFSPGLKLVVVEDAKGNRSITRQGPLNVLAGLPIVGFFGLDEREAAHTHFRIHKPKGKQPLAIPRGLTSRGLAQLQGWNLEEMDQTVRVTGYISLGGDNVRIVNDLKTLAGEAGIKAATVLRKSTDGSTNGKYSDDATVENILDLLAQALLNPNGAVVVFAASNSDDAFAGAAEYANVFPGVTAGGKKIKLSGYSISWGMAESANTRQSLERWARIGTAAQLAGLDVWAATGDDGANDRTDAPTPDSPSDIPEIQGAAGVGITSDGKKVTSIFPWDDAAAGGGETGYGISTVFAPTPEESGLNLPVSAVSGKPGHSASLLADLAQPKSGPVVLWNGRRMQVGGTSHSAPIQCAKGTYLKVKFGIVSFKHFTYQHGPEIVDRITQGDSSGPYPADPSKPYNVMTGFGVLNPTAAAAVAERLSGRKA